MKRAAEIARLAEAAALLESAALGSMRAAETRRRAVEAELVALQGAGGAVSAPEALQEVGNLGVVARHLQWRDRRRAALNTELAGHMAEWLCCHADARKAVGRAAVLRKLAEHAQKASRAQRSKHAR